jgi:hypothetical protein
MFFSEFLTYCGSLSLVGKIVMFSDIGITVAYFMLPVVMIRVLGIKKDDIIFPWLWVLFASFIISCGMSHLVHILQMPFTTFAHTVPEAFVEVVTAILSMGTAVAFSLMFPLIKNIPSPKQTRLDLEALVKIRTEHNTQLLKVINHQSGNQLQIMSSAINVQRRRTDLTPQEIKLLDAVEAPLMELIDRHITLSLNDFT